MLELESVEEKDVGVLYHIRTQGRNNVASQCQYVTCVLWHSTLR